MPAERTLPGIAETRCIAVHGWSMIVPREWEPVQVKGSWESGNCLLVHDREGRLSLTWERKARTPNLDKTLSAVDRQIQRERNDKPAIIAREAYGSDGLMARWAGPDEEILAAIHHLRDSQTTFIVRQLSGGPQDTFRGILDSLKIFTDGATVQWRLHGVEVDLPPAWRLTNIQHTIGAIRTIWFKYRGTSSKIESVLTLRRYACASRLLHNSTPADWLRRHMGKRERITGERSIGQWDTIEIDIEAPATTWWERLWGKKSQRRYHLWVEPKADRFVIQEWRGKGSPLQCLRRGEDSEDAPFLEESVPT